MKPLKHGTLWTASVPQRKLIAFKTRRDEIRAHTAVTLSTAGFRLWVAPFYGFAVKRKGIPFDRSKLSIVHPFDLAGWEALRHGVKRVNECATITVSFRWLKHVPPPVLVSRKH